MQKLNMKGFLPFLGIFLKAKFEKNLNTKVAPNCMLNISK
jgi:hypothetical protein